MLADRLVKMLLGAIAVLLAALFIQVALKSPSPAGAAYAPPDSTKVYDVKLISQFAIPNIKAIVPLGSIERTGVHFAVQTRKGFLVYRCDYYAKE